MSPIAQSLTALPFEEKLQLVWDLWNSISHDAANLPVSESDKAEMRRRLEAYQRDGDKGDSWEVVRKRIESKL